MFGVKLENLLVNLLGFIQITLSFQYQANLVLDVTFREWSWWRFQNKAKVRERVVEFALLFKDESNPIVNLINPIERINESNTILVE